jgi:transcriptional regulator with XRE-family HTH domain
MVRITMKKRKQATYQSLAEFLQEWTDRGKTQGEFAEQFRISQGHLSDLKNERVTPSLALAKRFRDECHIPIEAFLKETVS